MTTSATHSKKHIDQLHFEHKLWISASRLHADELSIYQQRLDEVAERNSGPEIRKMMGHFQSQFILQKEQLDILKHRINAHEHSLAAFAQEHPVAIDHVLFDDHAALRNDQETFERLFRELKASFRLFLEERL